MVAVVRFEVLGSLDVRRDDASVVVGSLNQRRLLSALLVHVGEVVSVDRLAEIVWSGEPPPSAAASLTTYISRVRALLGRDVIVTRPPGYALGAAWIDAREFERLLRDGAFEDAIALWRGRPFAEFADEEWARPSVLHLEELYATARELHIETLLAANRVDDAVALAEALCAAAPFRERAHGLLMQGLARQGRAAEALQAFDTYRRFLAQETGLEPSPALGDIQRAVLAQDEQVAPSSRVKLPLTNLPLQLSSFIGRADEVQAVAALLAEHRLVTLTGVGGVGKTRLALEVGAEVLPRFADGVWLVELAPLADHEMVLATVAEVLGVASQTGEPLATTLVSRLRAKQLLVIIDNCEHVLGPVARFVDRLAAAAPGVRVLATSREPLGIAAERVRVVPPLVEGPSVELFIDRAKQAGAVLDDSQRRAISDICVRLDGIPLAIELAAARARMMTPSQIAERLDQRFRLLTGGGRTAVERHRTLQATVSWSYELLDDTERSVFQRLSTLAGSFDLDAAEAIAAGGTVEGFEVLDALGYLVDKSMVLAVPASTGVRYRLLETLRQFAADRLAEQPDATAVQDRYAAYWRDQAVTRGQALGASDQAAILFDAIEVDFDNYRSAFAYLLSAGRVNDAAAGLLALDMFWGQRRPKEGSRWFQQLVAHPDLDRDQRLQALADLARFEASHGDLYAGEHYGTEAVHLAEASGVDPPWKAPYALMVVAFHRNDPTAFQQWWQQAHRIAMASGTRYAQLFIEAQRGLLPGAWDSAELIEHYERLLPEARRLGNPNLGELNFASVLHNAGQLERAREVAQSAIEPARRVGGSLWIAALFVAAALDALGGDTVRAHATAAQGLRMAHDEGHTKFALHFAFVAAALAARSDNIETAAVLLAGAARYGDPLGLGDVGIESACRLEAQIVVDAHPGDFTAARRRGETMTIDELATYTLDTLA